MRKLATRLLSACASAVPIAFLAACGGGGANNTVPPPLPTIAPPPTPTPSPYPSTNGDSFSYAGTLTQQFTVYGTPAPSPSPSATPEPTSTPWVSNDSQTVAQTVTLHAGATFGSTSGLTELETNETDTGVHSTYTSDSKQYLQFAANASRSNGIDLTQVALDASDSNGVKSTTTFGPGSAVLDELPQVAAAQWRNAPTRTIVESDPSGETLTTTYAADGTYAENTLYPEGSTSSMTENVDGSGVYLLPFLGVPGSEVTVSPVMNGAINITFKQSATSTVVWGSLPVWYPSVPPVFASDTFVDAGTAAIPASCNAAPGFGTQATRIDEKRARVDTMYGELETTTQSSYVVPPYGAVCVVLHDDLSVYYDYSGQSLFTFSATPLRRTIADETLGLMVAKLTSSGRRVSSVAKASRVFVAPSLARLHLTIARQHLQFVRRMSAALREAR